MHQVYSCVCVCVPLQSGVERRQTPGKARCNLSSTLVFFSLPPFPSFCPLPFSFSSLFGEELKALAAAATALPGCVGGRFQRAWLALEFGALRSAAVSRSRRLSAHTHSGATSSHTRSVSLYLSLSLSPPLWEWSTRCLRLCCRGLPPVSDLSHTYAHSIVSMMWEVRTAFLHSLSLSRSCLSLFCSSNSRGLKHCTTFACLLCEDGGLFYVCGLPLTL